MVFDAVARALVSYQHWTFYPVTCVARINLFAQSLLPLCSNKREPGRFLEILGLAVFWIWFPLVVGARPVRAGELRGDRDPARTVRPQLPLLEHLHRTTAGHRMVPEADDGDAGHLVRSVDGPVPQRPAVPGGAPPVPTAPAWASPAGGAVRPGALPQSRPALQ